MRADPRPLRQRLRSGLLLVSLLVFPLTLSYFSPYLVVHGARLGILSGSGILFGLLFLAALLLGRAWCGWICPGGALMDACESVRNQPFAPSWARRIKWLIWFPWAGAILACFTLAGGIRGIRGVYLSPSWVSIHNEKLYFVYYSVLLLFLLPTLLLGRRGGCHLLCWMAPFMVLGRALSQRLRLPRLRLAAAPANCTNCGTCGRQCPMSLEVPRMVQEGPMEHPDCVLCGTCVDACPKASIAFAFNPRRD